MGKRLKSRKQHDNRPKSPKKKGANDKGKRGKMYTANKEPVTVVVMDSEGKEVKTTVFVPWAIEYADALTQIYPWVLDKDGHLILAIPEPGYRDKAEYAEPPRKPLMCGFDAANDYLQAIFGLRLHTVDRNWYEDHPMTVPDGLPMGATLRVLQELGEPYGMRIARVRVAPGTSIPEGVAIWQKYLGVNPLALGDRTTSNDEFAEMAGIEAAAAHRDFRFEFGDVPLRPSIACTSGLTTDPKAITGWTGGHAFYLPPRGKQAKADMSIQFARTERDPWGELGAPSFEALDAKLPPEPPRVPDLAQMWNAIPIEVRDKLEKPFVFEFTVRPHRIPKPKYNYPPVGGYSVTKSLPPAGGATTAAGIPDEHKYQDGAPVPVGHCRACGENINIVGGTKYSGSFFCLNCWTCLFHTIDCPCDFNGEKCGTVWVDLVPTYRGWDRNKAQIYVACPRCTKKCWLDCSLAGGTRYERLMFMALAYNLNTPERMEFLALRETVMSKLSAEWDKQVGDDVRKDEPNGNTTDTKAPEPTGADSSRTIH